MQAGSSFQPPFYQNVYHAPAPGHQDHDLKRQYLTLLPPQQIIEICLAFEVHVPYYVKSSIWPLDINAAIAGMQKISPKEDAQTTETPPTKDPAPPMASLVEPSESQSGSSQQVQPPQEPPPPDGAPIVGPSPPDTATPVKPPQQAAYQPYAYPPMQAAYPHSPYYPPHPAYTQYQYPPYHNGYTLPHGGYPHSSTNPPYNPIAPVTAVTSPANQESISDDLPSYEEMIVEALTDTADPDGCAPKELFTWMASHYPLQSNFRPSASQALQKAFKRGRFEKSNGGKYRLNSSWEGGNTSRRTTRRPQTQNQPTPVPNPQSIPPFTHAPLIHQHNQPAAPTPQPYQAPPYGYPYTHMPGYPGYIPQPLQPQPTPAAPSVHGKPLAGLDADVTDAYEAAQNILKAINFSNLLPLPSEGENKASGVAQSTATPLPIAQQGSSSAPTAASDRTTPDTNPRAELQAQLALLAAQLAELARDHDGQPSEPQPDASAHFQPQTQTNLPPPSSTSEFRTPAPLPTPSTAPLPSETTADPVVHEEEESDSDDMDDMEEVI